MKKIGKLLYSVLIVILALSVLFACGKNKKSIDSIDSTSIHDSSGQSEIISEGQSEGSSSIEDQDEEELATTNTNIVQDVTAFTDEDVFAVKELNDVDFHTELQKAYLNDVLGSISKYASGTKELSYPEAVKLEWRYTPSDKTLRFINYEITFSENEDLSESKKYTVTSPELSLYNLKIGTEYYYSVKANYDTDSFETKKISFKTAEKGPRNLYIDGISNSRDVGGRATEDGGMVKQGLLYRTARLNLSSTNTLTIEISQKGMEQMRELGMKTEIDLRGYVANEPGGITSSPLGNDVNYYFLPMQWSGVANLLLGNSESIVRTFEILADKNNYPVFYHCNIGTDRTGMITMLVGGLLGIPEEELYRDYLFSNFGNIGGSRDLGDQSSVNSVYGYMNQLRAFKGNTFSEKVYNYLLTIGVPARNLNRTISILKDGGTKITGSSTFISTDDMVSNTTISPKSSTYKYAPIDYYVLNDSKSSIFAGFEASEPTRAAIYMYASNSNTSASINNTIKLKIDGVEKNVTTTTYNAEGCRSDAERYWIAIKLADVDLATGDHTVSLTSAASSGPNVAGIAIIPASGKIKSNKSAIVTFDASGGNGGTNTPTAITVNGKNYTSKPTDHYTGEAPIVWFYNNDTDHSIYQLKASESNTVNGDINDAGDVYLNSGGKYITFNIWMNEAATVDIVLLATVSDSSSTHEVSGSMQLSVNNATRTAATATGTYASYGATNTSYGTIPYATCDLKQGLNSIQIYRSGTYGCRVGYVRIIPKANVDRGDLAIVNMIEPFNLKTDTAFIAY